MKSRVILPLFALCAMFALTADAKAGLLDRMLGGESRPREPILLPPIGVATRRSTEVLAIDDAEVVSAVRYIREHVHLPLNVADVIRQVPMGRPAYLHITSSVARMRLLGGDYHYSPPDMSRTFVHFN